MGMKTEAWPMSKSIGQATCFFPTNSLLRKKGKATKRQLTDILINYKAWTLFLSLFKTNCNKNIRRQLEECKH